jgi:hypothetical protein
MRLTRAKSIELCTELWTWLAETGKEKEDWPEWEKYVYIEACCWFCEYDTYRQLKNKIYRRACSSCPLGGEHNKCCRMYYGQWDIAQTPRTRKKYAKLFLGQIKALRNRKVIAEAKRKAG